ncbi:MAG TPA: hypothetical protein DEH78_06135 [Solibacterales bacterium]|nr:hypothetical protein [Bryobacterales bacterium]
MLRKLAGAAREGVGAGLLRTVVALALLVSAGARAEPVSDDVLRDRLRQAHPNAARRYERLKALFAQAGCVEPRLREQPVKRSKQPNLICGPAGGSSGKRRIIVGAHFDSQGGAGVIDNWTGAVLLPSLLEFLGSGAERRHEFEFVGFAAEEKGLLGSRTYVEALTAEERARIAAVIVVDSVGLAPVKVWPNRSTPFLVNAAAQVAAGMAIGLEGVNVEKVGTTDSQVFYEAGIPVLTVHSVDQRTILVINHESDTLAAVSWKDFFDTYRMLGALLEYLDRGLPAQ